MSGWPWKSDAEHVVDLALLVVGGGPALAVLAVGCDRVKIGRLGRDAHDHGHTVDLAHVEQLVVHAKTRLVRVVVDAVHAHHRA